MHEASYIYNFARVFARELEKARTDPWNAQTLERFSQTLIAEGVSLGRVAKYLVTLRKYSKLLGKPFEHATKVDIVRAVASLEQEPLSAWTKRDYKLLFRRFFKWLQNWEEGYPPEVRWIRASSHIPSTLTKEQLLTKEELTRLVDAANNIRDKALYLVLHDSGRRIGEILSLRIRDIEFDSLGARLKIEGKSGTDIARALGSAPKLAAWLDCHPLKHDPTAPFWVTFDSREQPKRLTYSAARAMLKECVKRAGIKRRIWFKLFRHSRATEAAPILTQAQMNQMFGWRQGSRMPAVYIHLSSRDLDDAVLKLNGMQSERAQSEQQGFEATTCARCKQINPPTSQFCNSCGLCLDVKAAMAVDEARAKVDRLMTVLVKQPEVLKALMRAMEKLENENGDH